MKELDKNKAYDLRDLNEVQKEELLGWLKANDKFWSGFDMGDFESMEIIGFSDKYNEWLFDACKKEIVNALELFKDMKEITQEQKEQLLNLNDSRVNEILGVTILEDNTWYIYDSGSLQFNIKDGIGYGLRRGIEWINEVYWLGVKCNGKFRKATHEEVENALIAEAKRRGFEDGNLNLWGFNKDYTIMSDANGIIFNNGEWREPKPNKQEIFKRINELLKQL